MVDSKYELVKPIDGFDAGTEFEVTARYGGWHRYDVRLEPTKETETGSVELTSERLELLSKPSGTWEITRLSASS